MTPERMQCALRRRLRWPLPLRAAACKGTRCRTRVDSLGDHLASCPRTGLLKIRSRPLEKAWAQVFREAGARVTENTFLRDTNLPSISSRDGRRLEIVASGLPLHRGVPLGVDATMVSPLHADGSPWPHAAVTNGVAIARAEKSKATTYPELVESDRLRLLTLACEVGGRWSQTCLDTVKALAQARSRQAAPLLRSAAARGWAARWWALLSVAAQDCLASTLLGDSVVTLGGVVTSEPSLAEVVLDLGDPL